MDLNNELVPSQSSAIVDKSQTIYDNANGVNSSYLQQGVGTENLDQNQQLSVVQTGEPITTQTKSDSTSYAWVFLIVILVAVAVVAVFVYKHLLKQPEKVEEEKPKTSTTKPEKTTKPKSKKKLPRSKRYK